MSVNPKEIELRRRMLQMGAHRRFDRDGPRPRQLFIDLDIPSKQGCAWLEKWSRKGWYEWGVTIDLGWLTEEGEAAFSREVAP